MENVTEFYKVEEDVYGNKVLLKDTKFDGARFIIRALSDMEVLNED